MGVLFILGLSSASYGAGGSALTALTTAFVVDILPTRAQKGAFEIRWIHPAMAAAMAVLVILFGYLMDRGALDAIYTVAGYTYGPILGLFAFGILTRRSARAIPFAVIAAPVICLLLNHYSVQLLGGYRFGYELLPLNGLLTFLFLRTFSERP